MRVLAVTTQLLSRGSQASAPVTVRDLELIQKDHDVLLAQLVHPNDLSDDAVEIPGVCTVQIPYHRTRPETWLPAAKALSELARQADVIRTMGVPPLLPSLLTGPRKAHADSSAARQVLIASRIFSPEPAAASFRLSAVEKALVTQGFDVTVLTTVPAPGGEQGRLLAAEADSASSPEPSNNATVKRWAALRDNTGYVRGYLPYMSFDIPLFFRLLTAPKPDVILVEPPPTTGAVARVAAALRHVPYVWYAADVWSDATEATGAPQLIVKVLRFIERFAVRGASGIIAVSEGVAERVADLGGKNIRVIPNGIDTEVYSPKTLPFSEDELAALGVTGPYFVYAGTASEWQGAKVFAEAMAHAAADDNQVQAVFVGQGTQWDEIAEVAEELRGAHGRDVVVQVPPQSPQWVARLLAGSEGALVSIVPGQGYDFAYPTKVLAALAVGKPVIYAGKGPVVADITGADLGVTTNHDAVDVADALEKIRSQTKTVFTPPRLHEWVVRNRSMRAMGKSVADFLAEVADKWTRK